MFDLSGEKAIVTGGGQGLGKEMALALGEAGADVLVVQRRVEVAEETSQEINRLGRESIALKVDVTKPDDVENMIKVAKDKWGKIDILVNNAGVTGWVAAEKISLEEWNRVVGINLTGVFLCCNLVGKEMIKQRKGNIINISSIAGFIASHPQKQCHYNSAKAGVNLLTKSLAAEWASYNIRVNAIAPGYVATPMLNKADDKLLKEWASFPPTKRMADPEELKGLCVFLASRASSYVTGSVIIIDGGYTLW
jgi:NAD(P)-dependent dehydrogenase (short-subunit alcohol dehydrogenase family)